MCPVLTLTIHYHTQPRIMTLSQLTLPFTIPYLENGKSQAVGLLNLTSKSLTLEYQIESYTKPQRGDIQQVSIPLQEIARLQFQDRWLWRRLIIQTRSIVSTEDVPKSRNGRVELAVTLADRQLARRVERIVNQYLAERDLAQLERELEQRG